MKAVTKDGDTLKDSLADIRVAAEQLTKRTGLSEGLKVDLTEADEKLRLFMQDSSKWDKVVNTNFRTTTKEGREFAAIIATLRQKMSEAQDELATKTKQASDVQKGEFETLVTKTEEYKQGIESAKNKWKEFIEPLQQTTVISNMLQIVSSIGMISSSLMTLTNITNILNNTQLSTSEKALQIIMALGTSIPMLVNSGGKLIASVTGIGNAIKKALVSETLENAQLALKNELIQQGINKETAAVVAEQLMKASVDAHSKSLITEIALLAAKKALIGVGVVLAIGACAFAVYKLVEAYNAEAEAAKRANEAAEQAAESYQQIKQANSELEASFSAYDTAIEKLEECTKGTAEWEQALKDANTAARDVIDSVSGLSGEDLQGLYQTNSDGLLELNIDKIKEIQKNQNRRENSAALAADKADYEATKAQISSDLLDLARSIMPDTYGDRFIKGMLEGLPFLGPIGAGIGAGAETVDWENITYEIKRQLNNNMDELSTLPTKELRAKLQELGISVDHLSDTEIEDLRGQLFDLAESSEAAKNKLEALSLLDLSNIIGTRDTATTKMTKDDTDRKVDNKTRDIERTIQNMSQYENWWATAKPEYNDILRRMQAAGYNYSAGKNIVQGSGEDRVIQFYDNDKKDYVEIPYKLVASEIATDEVNKEANEIADEYDKVFQEMSRVLGKDFAENIKTFIASGEVEQFTPEQIKAIQSKGSIGNYLRSVLGSEYESDISNISTNTLRKGYSFSDKADKLNETSEDISNQYF